MMQLDELIKSMQALQEEVAKNNETIEQLDSTIKAMNVELEETREKEDAEVAAVREKWGAKRTELTQEIAAATQKKAFIQSSGESLGMAVKVIEAQFQMLSATISKQDVRDAIEIIRTKYESSQFESVGNDDLQPADFDEIEQQLGLSTEPTTEPDSESQAETG